MTTAAADQAGQPATSGPVRTCIGCRRRAPAGELRRVTRTGDGRLAVGRTLPGRGAWLCAESLACFDRAARRGAFARALRAPVDAKAMAAIRDDFAPIEGPARG